MDMLDALLQSHLSKSEEKRAAIQRAAEEKKQRLNPESAFNITTVDILDADTVRDRATGKDIRITAGRGFAIDSYESNPDIYRNSPAKEAVHRKSYADAYGLRPDQVTRGMLVEKGRAQKAQFAQRLAAAADENGNIRYQHRGLDEYNRILGEVSSNENTQQFLNESTNRFQNAGYKGNFNFLKELEDFQSGDAAQHNIGKGERSWTEALVKDQAVNLAYGTGEMVNSLTQAAAVGLGVGKETADFFEGNREGLQDFKEKFGSEEMLRGERMAANRLENRKAIASMKKAQYVSQGDSEVWAGTKAGVGEFVDTMQDFWQNPGRALDSAITSLPYMIGVGGVGGATAKVATNRLRTEVFKDLAAFSRAAGSRGTKGGIGASAKASTIAETRAATETFLRSAGAQKEIAAIVDKVGIGTVGLTEGMTNSADVYAEIMRMSEEEASQSMEYQKLRAQGMSHKDALHDLGKTAWAQTLVVTGILATAAAAGTGAGAFEARLFTGIRNPAKAAIGPNVGRETGRLISKTKVSPLLQGGKSPKTYYAPKKEVNATVAKLEGRKAPTAAQIAKGRKKILKEQSGVKPSKVVGAAVWAGTKAKQLATAKLTQEALKAGGKETLEETIQSGGGELVGQITKQKITGEEIGPGVGTAAAEGAIVGFLSGAGMASAGHIIKSGVDKLSSAKSKFDEDQRPSSPDIEKGGTVGKSISAVEKEIKAAKKANTYNAEAAFNSTFDEEYDKDETGTVNADRFVGMEIHYGNVSNELNAKITNLRLEGKEEEATAVQAKLDGYTKKYNTAQVKFNRSILSYLDANQARYKEGKLNAHDLILVETATARGVPLSPELEDAITASTAGPIMGSNAGIRKLVAQLQDTASLAKSIDAQITGAGLEPDSPEANRIRLKMIQVHDLKTGNTRHYISENAPNVPGIGRTVQEVSQALQQGQFAEALRHIENFKTFMTGQAKKLKTLNKLLAKPPKKGTKYSLGKSEDEYTFSVEGATALKEQIESEQKLMKDVHKEFQKKVKVYKKVLDLAKDDAVAEGEATTEGQTETTEEKPTEQEEQTTEETPEPTTRSAKVVAAAKAAGHKIIAALNKIPVKGGARTKAINAKVKETKGRLELAGINLKLTGTKITDKMQFLQNAEELLYYAAHPEGSDTGDGSDDIKPLKINKNDRQAIVYAKQLYNDYINKSVASVIAKSKQLFNKQQNHDSGPNGENINFAATDLMYLHDLMKRRGIEIPAGQVLTEQDTRSDLLKEISATYDSIQRGKEYISQLQERQKDGYKTSPTSSLPIAEEIAKRENQLAELETQYADLLAQQAAETAGGSQTREAGEGTTSNQTPVTNAQKGADAANKAYNEILAKQGKDVTQDKLISEMIKVGQAMDPLQSFGYADRMNELLEKHSRKQERRSKKDPAKTQEFNNNMRSLRSLRKAAQTQLAKKENTQKDWQDYAKSFMTSSLNKGLKQKFTGSKGLANVNITADTDPRVVNEVFQAAQNTIDNIAEEIINDYTDNEKDRAQLLRDFQYEKSGFSPKMGSFARDAIKLVVTTTSGQRLEQVNAPTPVGLDNIVRSISKDAKGQLNRYISYMKALLGDNTDVGIERKIATARAALDKLDSPTLTFPQFNALINDIHHLAEEGLRYRYYDSFATTSRYYRDGLQYIAEMGVDGTYTPEFITKRDAFLQKIMTVIGNYDPDTTQPVEHLSQITGMINTFIRENKSEKSKENAFLSGGVRLSEVPELSQGSGFTAREYLADNNIPARLADAFKNAGEPTSMLAVIPNWGTTARLVFDAENPNNPIQPALQTWMDFEEAFRSVLLDKTIKWDTTTDRSKLGTDSIFKTPGMLPTLVTQDPLWFLRDKNGNINENLITAMALEAFKYVSGPGQRTLANAPEEVARILGLPDTYTPNDTEMAALGGIGDVVENVYDLIGNALMAHMNIAPNGVATGQVRSTLPRALAERVVSTLEFMGLAKTSAVDMNEILGIPEEEGVQERRFIRLATTDENPIATAFTWEIVHTAQAGMRLNQEKTLTNMYGLAAEMAAPSIEPIEGIHKNIDKTPMESPEAIQKAQQKDQDSAYTYNDNLITALELFPEAMDYLEIAHNVQPILAAIHQSKWISTTARNGNFLREFDNAINWIDQLKALGATNFYVPVRAITNFRIMLVNGSANPQASKVHRAMFPKADNVLSYSAEMTPETAKGQKEIQFWRSVYQKLGTENGSRLDKVEFLTDEYILANVGAKIAKYQTLIDHIKKPESKIDGAPKFSAEQLADFKNTKMPENGETFMTLVNLAKLQQAQEHIEEQNALDMDGMLSIEDMTLNMYQPVQSDATTAGATNGAFQQVTRTTIVLAKREARRGGATFMTDSTTGVEYLIKNPDSYELTTLHLRDVVNGYATNTIITPTPDGNKDEGSITDAIDKLETDLAGKLAARKSKIYGERSGLNDEIYAKRLALRKLKAQSSSRLYNFSRNTVITNPDAEGLGIVGELVAAGDRVTPEGRNYSKDAFMLGNYDAGRKSAKRALASTSYNKMLSILATINDETELQTAIMHIMNVHNEMLSILFDTGLEVEGKSKYKMYVTGDAAALVEKVKEARSNFYIGQVQSGQTHTPINLGTLLGFKPATRQILEMVFSDTDGEAMHKALDAELKYKEPVKNAIHGMAWVSNSLFTTLLQKKIAEFQKAHNKMYPDVTRIKWMIDELVAQDLFPGIPSAVTQGTKDRITGVKREMGPLNINGKEVRAHIGFDGVQSIFDQNLSGIGTSVENPTFKDDPGVAPGVRAIQSLEAIIQAHIMEQYSLTNTYDGQGISGANVVPAGQLANESFIQFNHGWNIFDAFHSNMVSLLRVLHPASQQLSAAEKQEVFDTLANSEFVQKLGLADPKVASQTIINNVLAELKTLQEDVAEGHKLIWEDARTLVNYMGASGVEVSVARVLPNRTTQTSPLMYVNATLEELTEARQKEAQNLEERNKQTMIQALEVSAGSGINEVVKTVQSFIHANGSKRIGAGYLIEILQKAYSATNADPTLSTVINTVWDLLKNNERAKAARIYLSPVMLTVRGEDAEGTYRDNPQGNAGVIDIYQGSEFFLGQILHEVLHAISYGHIANVAENSSGDWLNILTEAKRITREMAASGNPAQIAYSGLWDMMLNHADQTENIVGVSELISYVITTFDDAQKDKMKVYLLDPYMPTLNLMKEIKTVSEANPATQNTHASASAVKMASQHGIPIVTNGSSSEDVDTVEFMKYRVKTLPGEQIAQVMQDVDRLEQTPENPAHNKHLDRLLQTIVRPGMASISDITVKMATKPDGSRNVGKTVGSTIYLEAAGNPLTSNVDMSLKEVIVHEYLHPIVSWALSDELGPDGRRVEGNLPIKRELQQIFDHVKKELIENHGGWRVLMPEDVVGDYAYAEQQAQERWDYIFENYQGKAHVEFLINGLVNEPLLNALRKIDSLNTTQPVWEGFTFTTLKNILGKIFRAIETRSDKAKIGVVSADLERLAGNIIAINMQNMQRILHKQKNTVPRADRLNSAVSEALGRKIAEPLRIWANEHAPTRGKSALADVGFTSLKALLDAESKDFQKAADSYFRFLNGEKDNMWMEMAQELMPDQKSQMIWKETLRKSKNTVDRARRSAIEDIQTYLRQHFDKSYKFKLKKAHRAALTNVGMRADLSALLGTTGTNFERVQRLVNSLDSVKTEIASKVNELQQATQGDTKLFNVIHNQVLGLGQMMITGQTYKANQQKNTHAIANQYFFSDPKHRRPLSDPAAVEAILEELKSLYALFTIHNIAPNDIALAAEVINHEMSRDVALNGFMAFMNTHLTFKEDSKERLFGGNGTQMIGGYVYEQYNPDIDMVFTAQSDKNRIKELEAKNYKRIGMMARDPADPLREPMIMWKGLGGNAMYMSTSVSYTNTDHKGTSPYDSLKLQNGMTSSNAGAIAKYNIQAIKSRMERDVLKQMDNPDVNHDQARATPILDEQGNTTNYTYTMSQNNKKNVLEANQDFDYLLGRMYGSIEDRINSQIMNSKIAKLLHSEYKNGNGPESTLRFVEISKYSKNAEAREMWELIPDPMKEELTKLFGGEHFYIRDDIINLVLGFRKFSIANQKWLGKSAFTVRAAERIWMDVIKLLKIKIVLTMPDVVLGNIAANFVYLLSSGIPPQYIFKEFKNGLQGIYLHQKQERELHDLRLEMKATVRSRGVATAGQLQKEASLMRAIKSNPIALLAEEGIFTGIAEELEPDTWNWRNKILEKVSEIGDSWVPSAVVSAAKEVMIVPGAQTFKVALAATQYADFIARHIQFKYDTEVRGKGKEESLQKALNSFIYYDVPQNVWLQYGNDLGFIMFTKYFFRIQQIIYQMYRDTPATAFSVLALQKMGNNIPYPYSSNISDYAFLDNFDLSSRLHMMPWRTMDGADMLTPALFQLIMNPLGGSN